MNSVYKLSLAASVLFASQATLATSTNGKDLHDANCQSCHASLMNGSPDSIYTRPDRKVTTVDGLRKQVSRCKTTIGVNWPKDKVQEVVDYLNTNFYKL